MFRVLTREKKELKASAGTGIQHQVLENRHYCFANDHWKKDQASLVQLTSLCGVLQGNP